MYVFNNIRFDIQEADYCLWCIWIQNNRQTNAFERRAKSFGLVLLARVTVLCEGSSRVSTWRLIQLHEVRETGILSHLRCLYCFNTPHPLFIV